jgi:hypothetical protein
MPDVRHTPDQAEGEVLIRFNNKCVQGLSLVMRCPVTTRPDTKINILIREKNAAYRLQSLQFAS